MNSFLHQYLKSLAVVSVFFIAMISTYLLIHRERIFPDENTVVVYGRDSCGFTQSMRTFLERRNISYIYANIDNPIIDREMWFHLHQIAASDLSPGYAHFPVVRVNGETLEQPHEEVVLTHMTRTNQ